MIKYTKSTVSESYSTEKFGNLLSDTYQGQVDQSKDGVWSGWFFNISTGLAEFRLGLKSKAAAVRWVNQKLREVGVE